MREPFHTDPGVVASCTQRAEELRTRADNCRAFGMLAHAVALCEEALVYERAIGHDVVRCAACWRTRGYDVYVRRVDLAQHETQAHG